jgi:hypothetical protein
MLPLRGNMEFKNYAALVTTVECAATERIEWTRKVL